MVEQWVTQYPRTPQLKPMCLNGSWTIFPVNDNMLLIYLSCDLHNPGKPFIEKSWNKFQGPRLFSFIFKKHASTVQPCCEPMPQWNCILLHKLWPLIQSTFILNQCQYDPHSANVRTCVSMYVQLCVYVILLSSKSTGCDLSSVIVLQFPSHSSCFIQTAWLAGPETSG